MFYDRNVGFPSGVDALLQSKLASRSPRIVFYVRRSGFSSGGTVVLRVQKTSRRRRIVFSWRKKTCRSVRKTCVRRQRPKRGRRITMYAGNIVCFGPRTTICELKSTCLRPIKTFYTCKSRSDAVGSCVSGWTRRDLGTRASSPIETLLKAITLKCFSPMRVRISVLPTLRGSNQNRISLGPPGSRPELDTAAPFGGSRVCSPLNDCASSNGSSLHIRCPRKCDVLYSRLHTAKNVV